MKLKNLWLIAVAILIYACNAEETRSWEVTFDPNKPKDPNEQSIINVAAGKFYKMNVVANSAYADKAPLDPWTSGTKLTDEETGTLSTKNRGVGWDAQTVEVIIDLGSLRSITEVSVHAISDPTSQIVFPPIFQIRQRQMANLTIFTNHTSPKWLPKKYVTWDLSGSDKPTK